MSELVEVRPNISFEHALWQAQKAIRGIGKGGRNDYSKYSYTTSEEMIREA